MCTLTLLNFICLLYGIGHSCVIVHVNTLTVIFENHLEQDAGWRARNGLCMTKKAGRALRPAR